MNNNKKSRMTARSWMLIWVLGLAGQICWNIENQWFNTFVYEKIAPDPSIISWMVAISAIVTTFSTFFFGTLSDRLGTRKPFITFGYILWGLFTIAYGLTMYVPGSVSGGLMFIAILVVLSDAVMSFFGSMGNDSGFNAWTSDMLDDDNSGAIGATLAAEPVLGTIIGTVVGGIIIAGFGYMVFFLIMGTFVILIGLLSLFTMKDSPNIKSRKDGSFWHQFGKAFEFKEFFQNKELVLVNIIVSIFFIGFNVYFVHIGNIFIKFYGFGADEAGYFQGIGLVLALISTIPAAKLMKLNKTPLALAIAFVIDIVGLLVLYFFRDSTDATGFLVSGNIPLIIGIILVGIGYVVTMQTTTVWSKRLYPEDAKGQFEGIRIIFFVLIPMILGPVIANPIIKSYGMTYTDTYSTGIITGMVPTPLLFLIASFVVAIGFIPLYFANKHYKKRLISNNIQEN